MTCPFLQPISNTPFGHVAICAVDHSPFQLKTQPKLGVLPVKNPSLAFCTSSTFQKGYSNCSIQLEIDKPSSKISRFTLMEMASVQQLKKLNALGEKIQEHVLLDLDGKIQKEEFSKPSLARITDSVCFKELERRRKIGQANRGRNPWNKGIKHNEETRMHIKNQTIKALSDPKVRKKMSEWPHSHSDQSKARISLAMRKFWHESLKLKRLQEKLYCSWARYIAEAAQRGGDDQREHDWDSYRKTNAELNFQYLQDREEKVKAREMAKLRAEQVAKERAEKLVQRTKMKEEKAKARTLSRQNLLNRKKKSALAKDLKLIRKLTKIQYRMKPEILATSRRASSVKSQPSIENLNLELIKREKVERSLSLADKLETPKSKEKKLAQS